MVEAVHAAVGVVEVVGGRVAVERLLELRFEEEAEKLKVLVEQMRAVIRWRGQVEFIELGPAEIAVPANRPFLHELTLTTKSLPMGNLLKMQITYYIQDKKI